MRFLSTLFLLSVLSALPVFARMDQMVSRTSRDHPAIASRQHHTMRASLADICASVDLSLLPKVSVAGLLEVDAAIKVHICLCVTVVPMFVKTDVRIKDYVDLVGETDAVINIRNMIRTADGSRACQFPQHSTPMISVGTGCGICEYECDETFRKRDGKCVCEESLYECNGKCTSLCGSSVPGISLESSNGRLG